MTITVTMTLQNAETLLSQLTHSASGTQVGNSTKITTQLIYAMNLPTDVIDVIPFRNLPSSASFTDMPGDILSGFVNGLSNLINGVVSLVTEIFITVWNLASGLASAIVDLGMHFLSTVWNTFVSQVTAAIDAIVDAFNAFVQWAIEFIQQTVNAAFSCINAIYDSIVSFGKYLVGMMENTPNISLGSAILSALNGNIALNTLFTVFSILELVLMIVAPVLTLCGFLISFIVPIVLSTVLGSDIGGQSACDMQQARAGASNTTYNENGQPSTMPGWCQDAINGTNDNIRSSLPYISIAFWLYGKYKNFVKTYVGLAYSLFALLLKNWYESLPENSNDQQCAIILVVAAASMGPYLALLGWLEEPSLYRTVAATLSIFSIGYLYVSVFKDL